VIFEIVCEKSTQFAYFGEMKLVLVILLIFFFVSLKCTSTCGQAANDIVKRFFYFNRLFKGEETGQNNLLQDFLHYCRSIQSLWDHNPAEILSITKNTVYFSFKHFFVQLVHSHSNSMLLVAGNKLDLKQTFFSFVPSKPYLEYFCTVTKIEAVELLKSLTYVEILNDLLMLKAKGLIDLAVEIALKINDTETIKDMSEFKFAIENIKFNYLDKTIDYDHFTSTFHEIEFLVKNPALKEKRLKELIRLLLCYWDIILYTSCFKVFELREISSNLMWVILSGKKK
jgi:hypothetical protein